MDERLRLKRSNRSYSRAWLEQARAELTDLAEAGPVWPSPVRDNGPGPAIYLIFGLVLLQLIVLVAALTVAFPGYTESPSPEFEAALDVSSAPISRRFGQEPPPPPTPRPVLQENFIRRPIQSGAVGSAPHVGLQASPQEKRLRFRGVEMTQGIQVFQEPEDPHCVSDHNHPNFIFCNNSIPMVAGRHTLIRAYVGCDRGCPSGDTVVRLRLIKDGQIHDSLDRQLSTERLRQLDPLAISELRLNLDNSVNFEFFPPPAWFEGQVTFELEATSAVAAEQTAVSLSLTKDFEVRKPLRIAYLPIEFQGMRPPDPVDIDYWMLRMYPVPEVKYYRLPMPDLVWEGDMGKSEVLRRLLYTYWLYAQYQTAETRPDQLFGWLPQELYNGGASDPFWCPNCAGPHSSRVAFGGLRPEQDIGGPRILVHEIAHNLGAQHAWSPTNKEDAGCFRAEGVDIRVDPDWPYAQTPHIQEVGLDLYSDPPVVYAPSVYDMMAYCTQPWISPHTYRKIFDSPFLKPDSMDLFSYTDFQPQVQTTEGGMLMVSGLVYPDGSVSRPEVIRLNGDAFGSAAAGFDPPLEFIPPAGDDYCLTIYAKDDAALAEHCFDVGFVDLETGLPTEPSPYFFTLPRVNAAEVEKVTVSKDRLAVITVSPTNSSPQVNITYPNGEEVLDGVQTITWDGYDDDGDLLRYDLLYSPDGGLSWLPLAIQQRDTSFSFQTNQVPPSTNGLIRVIASDGFNTAVDESDRGFAIRSLPRNSISMLGPASVKPGQKFEVSIVANQVAEPGLFGVQFEIDFDPDLVRVEHIRAHSSLELVVDETIEPELGRVSLVASRIGRVSNLTGQLTLATLSLTAGQREGPVQLEFFDVMAGARDGTAMPISEIHGLSLQISE